MKKNKLYLFIILLIAVLIFSAAAMCESCDDKPPVINTSTANSSTPEQDTQKDTTTTISTIPIHGVVPTKVTGFSLSDDSKEIGTLECWNVGEHGGRNFSKATYTISSNGKTIKTYDGYFRGGPNGRLSLGIKGEKKGISGDFVDGKKVVLDNGNIIIINNPEAFDGWTDEIPSDDNTEDFDSDVDVIAPEKDATDPDANLIHGVVPTKVTAHGNSTSAYGVWESNFEFWNVGKLGGEQYAEATMRAVLVEKAEGSTISDSEKTEEWEGYFTGGPNGTLYLSIMYEGMLNEIQLTLKDGKVISNAFEQGDIPMDNPDAFNGWID